MWALKWKISKREVKVGSTLYIGQAPVEYVGIELSLIPNVAPTSIRVHENKKNQIYNISTFPELEFTSESVPARPSVFRRRR